MNFKVLYNPEIYNDIIQAVEWYNTQKDGLGTRFLTLTKKQLQTLKRSALHYAIRYDDIRCIPIKQFPYMAHYRVDIKTKTVKVEALICMYRNPSDWIERTG